MWRQRPTPRIRNHRNSQHVLAIRWHNGEVDDVAPIRKAFQKTSELPCDFWTIQNGENNSGLFLLASNYPNCITEGTNFVVLCGGMPYGYQETFSEFLNDNAETSTFVSCVLRCVETTFAKHATQQDGSKKGAWEVIRLVLGKCLKQSSGHFLVVVYHKTSGTVLALNDPFGFMPLFHACTDSCVAISSYWDCLLPMPTVTPSLDWDVVAEYLTLGTTLGGIDGSRTFCKHIRNAAPGSFLCITTSPFSGTLSEVQQHFYVRCYGACELMAQEEFEDDLILKEAKMGSHLERLEDGVDPPPIRAGRHPWWTGNKKTEPPLYSAGVEVERPKLHPKYRCGSPSFDSVPPSEKRLPQQGNVNADGSTVLVRVAFSLLRRAVCQAFKDQNITGAALTGGGDTRLALACAESAHITRMEFQTHPKQRTDLQIAKWLASHLHLNHHTFHPVKNRHLHLEMLHDEIPFRRKQRKTSELYREEVLSHVMHGRFGTELMGFFCFDKSSVHVRCLEDVETYAPLLTKRFCTIFGNAEGRGEERMMGSAVHTKEECTISNPQRTLRERIVNLKNEKVVLQSVLVSESNKQSTEVKASTTEFDVAYALQLQLFTRAFFCDIYGGLRGSSWFAMPYAYFVRHSFSPFLDPQLLRLLLCRVSAEEKAEPYEWYGIPRALKTPEQPMRPFQPKIWSMPKSHAGPDLDNLKSQFTTIFWEGAMTISLTSPTKIDPNKVASDKRPEVQALVREVGAEEACVLSARLASFLLWYERRFLRIQLGWKRQ